MAKLVVVKGPDRGQVFRLSQTQPQIIGRKNAPLLLSDAQSSRNHAEFFKKDGRWFVKDLGSANGTIVNREKIDGIARLRDGYAIKLGMTKLVFKRSTKKITRPPKNPQAPADIDSGKTKTEKPKPKKIPKPKKQRLDKLDQHDPITDPNDASSLMMSILEDITPEPVIDIDSAEYIPDYDPMNPKTHRMKNSPTAEPDAETIVPEEIGFDIDLGDHEDEPSLDDSSVDTK